MVQVVIYVSWIVIGNHLPAKLILKIGATRRAQQSNQQGTLVKIVAAFFQQGQFRPLFCAVIKHEFDVVMDIIEYQLRIVLQAIRQRLNLRRDDFRNRIAGHAR